MSGSTGVFLLRMPAGIPGNVSRQAPDATIRQTVILASAPPSAYGNPVALDSASGKVRAVQAGDTAATLYGFLVRPFPTQGIVNDPLGYSTPPLSGICNTLKRGYINVLLNGTIPAGTQTPVYVRVAGATAGKPLGGVEGGPDPVTPANTVQMVNAFFTGAADAQGNTEVEFNI